MSRFHVPVPDYDFTIGHRNPYIPTPDYTVKYIKPKSRPSLNNIGSEYSSPYISDTVLNGSDLPPITIPIEVSEPIKKEPDYIKPALPKRHIDENSNFPEIKKHSYIEDHGKEERHISTKEHIKQIGVPVLPGIASAILPSQNFEVNAPVASDQNRAYLRHLENHKKFDTLQGDRGIEDCEICQIMRKQLEAERFDNSRGHNSWEQPKHSSHYPANQNSNPGSGKKRGDVREVFNRIDEQPEPEPLFRSIITARARHNYEMRREGEASIKAMEQVDILNMEREYVLCRKSDNTYGWIPSSVFDL